METVLLGVQIDLLHGSVSTLPIRNGNIALAVFIYYYVSTLPIRNGNVVAGPKKSMQFIHIVSTLPIRNKLPRIDCLSVCRIKIQNFIGGKGCSLLSPMM